MALVRFVAAYLQHIHVEETLVPAALRRDLSPEARRDLVRAGYADTTPETFDGMVRRLIPLFNRFDRADLVRDILAAAPAADLAPAILRVATEALDARDLDKLLADVPALTR